MTNVRALSYKPLYNYLRFINENDLANELLKMAELDRDTVGSFTELTPEKTFYDIFSHLIHKTKDPLLGLHIGKWIQPSDFGLFGYVLMSSQTIGHAYELTAKINPYGNYTLEHRTKIKNDIITFYLSTDYELEKIRPWIEMSIASWNSLYHHLTAFKYKDTNFFLEVGLKFPPAGNIEEYERAFDCPVTFSEHDSYVVFNAGLLKSRVNTADSELLSLFLNKLGVDKNTISKQVETFIASRLPEKTTLDQAAGHLDISSSTLKRALNDEELSFSAISTTTKLNIAKKMLDDESNSLTDIALQLGYTKSSVFQQAFKKAYGMTPKEYREQCIL